MDKVHKPSDSVCYTPSSEPFRFWCDSYFVSSWHLAAGCVTRNCYKHILVFKSWDARHKRWGMFIGFEGQANTATHTFDNRWSTWTSLHYQRWQSKPITNRIPLYAFCWTHVPLWRHSCLAAVTPSLALNYNEVKQVALSACRFDVSFLHADVD
jgi:hypothetical protein